MDGRDPTKRPNTGSERRPGDERDDEELGELTRELVETLATAYFSTCRRLAQTVSRLKDGGDDR